MNISTVVTEIYAIIASSLQSILLTKYAINELVEVPLKLIQRLKDLPLCIHVVFMP